MATRLSALGAIAGAALALAAPASALPSSHGHPLRLAAHLRANAQQSSNWFGYDQGTIEQGTKLFSSVSGDWTVPTATQHTAGKAASSSTWIGIGGGCMDANCLLQDKTLIQTGTEQDVDAAGKASYSAWWEIIPAPSLDIAMKVSPGDRMHADISEAVPLSELWTITLKNLTTGQAFTQTVPYPSLHGTAEWIEETPLLIGTNAGFSALPNLSTTSFTNARTNGQPANLKLSEQIQLTDSANRVIGTPSAPNASGDGFNECAWASSC